MADYQTTQNHNDHDAREKVWEMIKDVRVATLVTQTTSGTSGPAANSNTNMLRARPMVAASTENHNELWFFTPAQSGKVKEIEANNQICLSYAEPSDQNYVSISGTARISHDRAMIEKLWSEPMRTWFPKGAEDPNIALICVTPEAAEYWDSPSSTLVYAYGYLKARLTGEAPNPGDHDRVAM